ncbi:MAG: hypothetical protein ACYDA9_18565 [Terriglobia bacterium]
MSHCPKETLAADDADVSFIEADVVDASGVIVPSARQWILTSVKGPGRLLGSTNDIDAISGVAAINVQSTCQPGEIEVSASARALPGPGAYSVSYEVDSCGIDELFRFSPSWRWHRFASPLSPVRNRLK